MTCWCKEPGHQQPRCWPSFDKMMFDWAGGVYICSELTCQLGQLAALPGARWWLHWARHHELAANPGVTMPTWHWNQELLTHWSLKKLVNILHTPFQIHAGCCVFGTSWFYPYIPGAWVTKVNKDFQTWHLTGWQLCCQPIRSHVRKSVLINMAFIMDFN